MMYFLVPLRRAGGIIRSSTHLFSHRLRLYSDSFTANANVQSSTRFGIVSAMSKNSVIGVNGDLPWNLPEDRKIFTELTKDRILIIGRRTFEENPKLGHVNHCSACIVVSRTLRNVNSNVNAPSTLLKSATSLSEAIEIAREIWEATRPLYKYVENIEEDDNNLLYWVAGGHRIYTEALVHPFAAELHLSMVDVDVDESQYDPGCIARFPPTTHWEESYEETYRKTYPKHGFTPGFTYHVFRKTVTQSMLREDELDV